MVRGSPDVPDTPEPKKIWVKDVINIVQVKEYFFRIL